MVEGGGEAASTKPPTSADEALAPEGVLPPPLPGMLLGLVRALAYIAARDALGTAAASVALAPTRSTGARAGTDAAVPTAKADVALEKTLRAARKTRRLPAPMVVEIQTKTRGRRRRNHKESLRNDGWTTRPTGRAKHHKATPAASTKTATNATTT
jgi:hypothetical protein